jgi:uncharacterized membrane protein YjjB (DUF3815 family)
MTDFWLHLLHQALFGGIAAAGFGILFNSPPRMIVQFFASGALALAIRTAGQATALSLPEASFLAALIIAAVERSLHYFQSTRGSVLAVAGCIPMIPGSIAANGLKNLLALLSANPGDEVLAATNGMKNLLTVAFTLTAIGTALAIPRLLAPIKTQYETS